MPDADEDSPHLTQEEADTERLQRALRAKQRFQVPSSRPAGAVLHSHTPSAMYHARVAGSAWVRVRVRVTTTDILNARALGKHFVGPAGALPVPVSDRQILAIGLNRRIFSAWCRPSSTSTGRTTASQPCCSREPETCGAGGGDRPGGGHGDARRRAAAHPHRAGGGAGRGGPGVRLRRWELGG
jgi:hypothetical protein